MHDSKIEKRCRRSIDLKLFMILDLSFVIFFKEMVAFMYTADKSKMSVRVSKGVHHMETSAR